MLSIIVAVAQNGVIGCENRLIWHISEDLKYFKGLTTGHTIIMGRKTFESIGKPLPNRTNIVITNNKNFKAEGCLIAHSLTEAIALTDPDDETFIIGGGSVYNEALLMVDKVYLTQIHRDYEGDTFFTRLDANIWTEVERLDLARGDKFEYPFSFISYIRR